MRQIVEKKAYVRTEWEPEFVKHVKLLELCQHVMVKYNGEMRKAYVHRLHPKTVEIKLYAGPMIRRDPFALEALDTRHN